MSLVDFPDESQLPGLNEAAADPDPFRLFQRWLDEAQEARLPQPYGMTLATATPDGRPSARMVLLRGFDARGFSFYTNYESRKADELTRNPQAALVFYWAGLERQVRVEGRIERVSAAESDVYFASRPRGSQLSACASPQSRIVPDREGLEKRAEELAVKYEGRPVPRPATWGGYRVVPAVIEFWQGRENRLHDRLRYMPRKQGGWSIERLAP